MTASNFNKSSVAFSLSCGESFANSRLKSSMFKRRASTLRLTLIEYNPKLLTWSKL